MLGDGMTCHLDAGKVSSLGGTAALTRFRETSTIAGW